MFFEIALFITFFLVCILCRAVSDANQDDRPDLADLRQSERRGMEPGARKELVKTKLFFKHLEKGDSIRSLRHIWGSTKDMYHANNISTSTSSLSRSWRAAETSVRQFRTTKQECSICLDGYQTGETICWSRTDACDHVFHDNCICEWLKDHDECPLCRTDIVNSEVVVVVVEDDANEIEIEIGNNTNAPQDEEEQEHEVVQDNSNADSRNGNNNAEEQETNDVEDGNNDAQA